MHEQSNPYAPAAVPAQTECKCCGAACTLAAVVDAARSGIDARAGRTVEAMSGQAVYYYRCSGCGCAFTRAFDHWTPEDFARNIYNADYGRHDPGYANGERGTRTAGDVIRQFGAYAARISVLDWGSGEGSFAATLRRNGFVRVDEFDPFATAAATRPVGRYDMVTCFEVIEHVTDPAGLVADLAACRGDRGAILLSTLCCTPQVVDFGLQNWHYCVPRNGHISLLSARALMHCARRAGLVAHSFSESAHVLFDADAVPFWLAPVLPRGGGSGAASSRNQSR